MTHEEYKQQLTAWAGLTEKRLGAGGAAAVYYAILGIEHPFLQCRLSVDQMCWTLAEFSPVVMIRTRSPLTKKSSYP